MNKRLIYAEDAIDAVCEYCEYCEYFYNEKVIQRIKEIPSAQPEHTETHSCDYERTETHDLVSRDAVIKAILQLDNLIYTVPDYIDAVRSVPSAEPESRREWYMKGYRDAQNAALHESCTDCPLYDHDRHNCPRFNKVIPATIDAAKPRWIAVEEALPEDDKRVLCQMKGGELVFGFHHGKYWAYGHKPIAWFPLPEPYKEGQDENN